MNYKYLNECFSYDYKTGVLTWRERPENHFFSKTSANQTNSKNAFKVAGTKNNRGGVTIAINRKSYQAHRIIWMMHYQSKAVGKICHLNGDKSDNRIENLADATFNNNSMVGETGFYGVSKQRDKYRATGSVNGKSIFIGSFDTPELAHQAYLDFKNEL